MFGENKVGRLLGEFPFAKPYVDVALGKTFRVGRIDLGLLEQFATTLRCGVNYQGEYLPVAIRCIIFDREGKFLSEVKPSDLVRLPFSVFNPKTWMRSFSKGQTVGEAIDLLPNPDIIGYVLMVESFHNPSPQYEDVTLYKVPTGTTLSDMISSFKKKELEGEIARAQTKLDQI